MVRNRSLAVQRTVAQRLGDCSGRVGFVVHQADQLSERLVVELSTDRMHRLVRRGSAREQMRTYPTSVQAVDRLCDRLWGDTDLASDLL